MIPRKNKYCIRYKAIDVDGNLVLVHVVEDLDDGLLREHFAMAIEREDFEYCEALKVEARLRRIKITV